MWNAISLALAVLALSSRWVNAIPAAEPDIGIPDFVLGRDARHFSTFDFCSDAVCDQMVRQANGLARLKLIRKYIVNSVSMMDKLLTALDAELIVAGETLTRSLGNRCRAAHAVIDEVTKGPVESDRLNSKSSVFVYGQDFLNRAG